MKRIIIFLLLLTAVCSVVAAQESNPVRWNFSVTGLPGQVYEIHLTATVASGWHIYSQFSPENGGLPTRIRFTPGPLLKPEGKIREDGKLVLKFEKVFDTTVKYFEGKVDFVQRMKLKGNVKTNVTGILRYMVCNDHECLNPDDMPFTIPLP